MRLLVIVHVDSEWQHNSSTKYDVFLECQAVQIQCSYINTEH